MLNWFKKKDKTVELTDYDRERLIITFQLIFNNVKNIFTKNNQEKDCEAALNLLTKLIECQATSKIIKQEISDFNKEIEERREILQERDACQTQQYVECINLLNNELKRLEPIYKNFKDK